MYEVWCCEFGREGWKDIREQYNTFWGGRWNEIHGSGEDYDIEYIVD